MKVALIGRLDIGLNNNVSFEAVDVDPNVRFLEVELIFAVNGIGFISERCEIGVIFFFSSEVHEAGLNSKQGELASIVAGAFAKAAEEQKLQHVPPSFRPGLWHLLYH